MALGRNERDSDERDSEQGYRKIITTPEGFDKKVLPAMYKEKIAVYEEYFLLFDECEKPVQDVGYRGDIYLPVEDFFKFKGKAMVSATPIIPSDPRFEEPDGVVEILRILHESMDLKNRITE